MEPKRKKLAEVRAWCKHITQNPRSPKVWWVAEITENYYVHVPRTWKICPDCFKKRPK